jgi:hypothetical protein
MLKHDKIHISTDVISAMEVLSISIYGLIVLSIIICGIYRLCQNAITVTESSQPLDPNSNSV